MVALKQFTMSALSAVIAIRRFTAEYPNVEAKDAAKSIPRIDSDFAGADFVTGLTLHELLPQNIAKDDTQDGIRAILTFLLTYHSPWWLRVAPLGRSRVLASLSRDEAQCLRAAGLFSEVPDGETIAWWDWLAQRARSEMNDRLLVQGREGERLSLAFEQARIAKLGIQSEPRWVAIEDNTVGYDIQSFEIGLISPVNRLIEVKSSTQDPPRIILTRNEWDTAQMYGTAYVFHVWQFPSEELFEFSVSDISLHIPHDKGSGKWSAAEILLF